MKALRLFIIVVVLLFCVPTECWARQSCEEIIEEVRVQVLSPTLVRIELKGPRGFENRKTFHITERAWPGVSVMRTTSGGFVNVEAPDFTVKVPSDGRSLDGIVITDPGGNKIWSMPSSTEDYVTIKCGWTFHGDAYLFDDGDKASCGSKPESDYYYWSLESFDGYTQIKNKATGDYIHIRNNMGYVECTAIEADEHSKDWTLEDAGNAHKRLLCRWSKRPDYVHIEMVKGYAEHSPAGTDNGNDTIDRWMSATWSVGTDNFFTNNRYWLPHPNKNTRAWAIVDTPRYVPSDCGYNIGSAKKLNNGWDIDNDAQDVYVFLPKGDGRKLRSEYLQLTGRSELIPLYAFGGWDSRYYPYTQQEALEKIDTYRSKNIPLDVFVVDTDWRIGASHGYGVNTKLFPDMKKFIADAHSKNVRIVFNDHPEPQAEALVAKEVEYRNGGLRGKFDIGLDFWWYDRNWGTFLIPPGGINKEVFGMYIYHEITRDYYPDRRPMIMANVDGIDNGYINSPPNIAAHRYTMQWTGDTWCDYESLKREVKNAVHAGVFAPFAYVSTDVGGHMGTPTIEQYCRWVQFGALSPIFRLHCTRKLTRDPWDYASPAEEVVRKYVQMRMRLLPVFYTAARKNYDTGEPILRRCDLDYPGFAEAERNDQYLLGDSILVAPIITSGNSRSVWIPPGKWINQWTGSVTSGPKIITSTVSSVKEMPIFVKAGAVLPLAANMGYTGEQAWNPITIDIHPGINQAATGSLYEDDTISNDYKCGNYRKTDFEVVVNDVAKQVVVNIKAAKGTYKGALSGRSWVVRLRQPVGWSENVQSVTVDGTKASFSSIARDENAMPFGVAGGARDGDIVQVSVPLKSVNANRTIVISFAQNGDY